MEPSEVPEGLARVTVLCLFKVGQEVLKRKVEIDLFMVYDYVILVPIVVFFQVWGQQTLNDYEIYFLDLLERITA